MNSLWLVVTALAAFAVAYRLYGAFLAAKVAVLDDRRVTPAHRLRDNVDYHPTRRLVLFGVHFAAIAGPGPLVGPVLASQWGYAPGFAWLIIGACLAGGVHDFVVLLASVRHNGQSLPQIARSLLGPLAGVTTTLATLFIIIATLAGVAMVVVNALSESAWGMFTIVVTIPAALLTGLWMNKIRPGRVGEASVVGVTLVLLGVIFGKAFSDSSLAGYLIFTKPQLSVILPVYAAIASILPVWLLLCPRDYLSSYMKIGVIVLIAAGILIAQPTLNMPATTPFLHGGGPVMFGSVWPFVCIVIMCGALSGFHALIGSGTTPKMVNRESDIRVIGYGAMLLEGFVSVTALIAACALEPGDYFRINYAVTPPPEIASVADLDERARLTRQFGDARYAEMTRRIETEHQWNLAPVELKSLETGMHEELASRVGGAVTLAAGMAKVFSKIPGMNQMAAYWYHFVIMFEALFILTLLETGTRVARFIFEDSLALFRRRPQSGDCPDFLGTVRSMVDENGTVPLNERSVERHRPNWILNVSMSLLVCFLWGYLVYTSSIDTLWNMMGIANQLLAAIALTVGTTYLLVHAPKRVYALCTGVPLVFVVGTVFTAGVLRVQAWWEDLADPSLGPAKVFSLRLMCVLASIMLALTTLIVLDAVRRWYAILTAAPVEEVEEVEVAASGRPLPLGRE